MKAEDKIYVREYPDGSFNPAWETKRKDDPTTVLREYIRKDALLEWLENEIQHLSDGSLSGYYISLAYKDMIEHLNEM